MKISRSVAVLAAIACLLFAQTPDERARMREQQAKEFEAWAREHPPRDSTGLVPLPEFGKGMYQGFEGGLYPGGANGLRRRT